MQHDEWDSLRVLLTVGRAGSFGAAARTLQVDRATVMRRIDAIEERLGAHLVRRSRDGCALTDSGRSVFAKLEAIEDAVGAVRTELAGTDSTLAGVVRLTAPEWLSFGVLAPELVGLRREHPSLGVELVATNEILSLTKRQADIAIRNVKPKESSLVLRKLRPFAFALYASRRHAAKIRDMPWAERDVLMFEVGMEYMPGMRWFGERVPAHRVALRVSETMPLVAGAEAGLGVAVLPCALGDRAPDLVRVSPGVVERIDVWIVTHKDLLRQRRVRVVLDFLARVFERHAPLISGTRPRPR